MFKVCHMTSAHNSRDVRIFHKMCVSLVEAGFETYLVAPGESFVEKGVHVIGTGEKPASRLKRFTQMSKKVYEKALEIDADLYHLHDPELLPYALKLKKKGKHVIFDCHEDYEWTITEKKWIPFTIRRTAAKIFSKYQAYVCKKLDAVISVTPHICEYLGKYNSNIWMICNFPIIENDLAQKNNTLTKNKIVFAGGVVPNWNHANIINAIKDLDIEYTLLGRVSKSYLEQLKNTPGWDKVNYLGIISHNEVAKHLSDSNAGLALTLDYRPNGTLGNTKLFEYMIAGIPVICTNTKIWKEIVETYKCGICINPDKPEEILTAIKTIISNPEQSRQMGENGRNAVLNQYNWDVEKQKLIDLYMSLMK